MAAFCGTPKIGLPLVYASKSKALAFFLPPSMALRQPRLLATMVFRESEVSNVNVSMEKVIIVEGLSDKKKIMKLIKESVEIICTNGTIGLSRLDELSEELEGKDVYILVDADGSGESLRKQLKREFPQARHLYIDRKFREVATTPSEILANILIRAHIDVYADYL
ncbi:5S rRNA maturation endonuclease (ribonuclease M5) [Bacillus thermophilus]|uniref:5S rRNA maturation endonuclease (Ribonuclease M5) n=3 Tax=Bacillaceae TaxID=186817 RepID=A0ABS2R2V3_9BACI|nr:5S rRNA maturation endonuclease (ribonuclease M5) [Siminovitchia thermophila]